MSERERVLACLYVDMREANGDEEEKRKRKSSSERPKKGRSNENESKNYGNGIME